MNTKTLTAIAVILAAIPAMSWAQQGGPMRGQPPQIDFATADADASGGISAEEWSAYVTEQMATHRAEAMGTRADELIAAGDADADGALTRDELIAGFTALGEQRRAEREEMRGERGGDRGGERGHGHDRGHDRGHGHGDRDGARDGGRGGDRGGDHGWMGRGGRDMEPGERMSRIFDRIDDNSDGQIDADELSEMQDRMQRRMDRRNN